jgi:hypothetical protein
MPRGPDGGGPEATAAGLLDPLDAPRTGGVAAQYESHPVVGAGRHQVCAVLLDAGPVVDQHELERLRREAGPRRTQGFVRSGMDERAVPAAVRSACLLESVIGLPDVLLTARPIRAPAGNHEAPGQEQEDDRREDDQDDG